MNSGNSYTKFFIVCHGHGSTREGGLKFGGMYYRMGYSVVLFDMRGHGDNVRVPCTMGYQESQDLVELIHYIKERFGQDIELALHGTSLGGATVLMSTKYQQEANFIIVDCPYASIRHFVLDIMKQRHTISILLPWFIGMTFKVFYHYSYKDMNTSLYIVNNEIPTLFLHGAKDTFILPYHSDILFKANKGPKEQHIFPNGTHGESVFCDPDEYLEVTSSFIKRCENKQ